jgi:hypothetical protein
MYMCKSCLYQTGHVYVYELPVPNRSTICYTHIHDLFGTGNLYTYTWPVWYRQFIQIYMTYLVQAILPVPNRSCICVEIACTKQVMYMCRNSLYQASHVYVYNMPVPRMSCICVKVACTKPGNLYTYTWDAWYRLFLHIYMICLVQAIYTHIPDLLYMCITCLCQECHVYV